MKRSTLLFVLLLLTAVMTAVEYCCGCPLVFASGVFYIGLSFVAITTIFCIMLRYRLKDILWCITGGTVLVIAANSALSLIPVVIPHLMDDGIFLLCAVIVFCIYMNAVGFAAIYVLLFYFCRFKNILKQID